MTFITLDEAKKYLRVDFDDDDELIGSLLDSAGRLCRDIARLTDDQWAEVDSDVEEGSEYTASELKSIRTSLRIAVLYAAAYMYEHREEADHHALTLTLRALLFSEHEGGF